MSTADKSSYLALGSLHPYHFCPLPVDTSGPNPNFYRNPNPSYHTNPTTAAGYYSTGFNVAVGYGRVRVSIGIRVKV